MKQFTVRYFDNFRRTSFDVILDENISTEDLIKMLDKEVTKRGYAIVDSRSISIMGLQEISEDKPLSGNQPVSIVYTNVVCPNNAYRFDYVNGIEYFFHTEERNHIMSPHIHAKTSGDEIRFTLSGEILDGSFKSPSKAKEAKKYVKTNSSLLKAAWDSTIYEGHPLTKKVIEADKDKWLI